MKTKYNLWLILGVCCGLSVYAADNLETPKTAEIKQCFRYRIPEPSLENFKAANADVQRYLGRKLAGYNVACYIAPVENGFVLIWINGQIPEVTSQIKSEVETMIEEYMKGHTPSDSQLPTGKELGKGVTIQKGQQTGSGLDNSGR